MVEPFRAADALSILKAFQRNTVDYVFDRLYGDDPTMQFLVADEVGTGKTMVARGIVAKTIEHLWSRSARIDVLYICSNQAIASQNLNRLNVLDRKELTLPTRMTLVPLRLRGEASFARNKVNFVSLTPGTTFNLRSSTGVVEERAFLFELMLPLVGSHISLFNLLRVDAGDERWGRAVDEMTLDGIDVDLVTKFRAVLSSDPLLMTQLEEVLPLFARRRSDYPPDSKWQRNALISRLRTILSRTCVDALEPDLIILDEFQKFTELLHGDTEAAELARSLFGYIDKQGNAARTLLLSATPYRLLSMQGDEEGEGDHYSDLMATLRFLFGERGDTAVAELEREMRAFRAALQDLPHTHDKAVSSKCSIEAGMRQVVSRTERVGSTAARDAMVSEPSVPVSIGPLDLQEYVKVAAVARAAEQGSDIVEFWKSAPYLLSFMRNYALGRSLKDQGNRKLKPPLRKALEDAQSTLLLRETVDSLAPLDPPSGRMRAVMDDIFSQGLDRCLWIPPSLPYYGEKAAAPATKALVFSSWALVPDVMAAVLSYEAERRAGVGETGGYFRSSWPRPLQFRVDGGKPGGMRSLHLLYPSPLLARVADPLVIAASVDRRLTLEDMRIEVANRLREHFASAVRPSEEEGGEDAQDWVLSALADVGEANGAAAWLASGGLVTRDADEGFAEHAKEFSRAAKAGGLPSQMSEADISLLTDVALGSPAVCALRALSRVIPALKIDDPLLLKAAFDIAWGFRALFNQHDSVALLRSTDDRYWHRALVFAAENNLQAVLDEYAHYLIEGLGVGGKPGSAQAVELSDAIRAAVSVRPSQIDVESPRVVDGRLSFERFQMRGRFAMRLSDRPEEEKSVVRLSTVREAFNSPFRPFVLATTSVGQEGLDFHPYCHRIYHWNLPRNPVDLEQREGRVHRFKSHAVRLNVAFGFADTLRGYEAGDPWAAMFAAARAATSVSTDLVPYWLCEGPIKVERRVPILPFSREATRLEWLKRSLTVYRLAFGQPRQEELLAYLTKIVGHQLTADEIAELQISLEPPQGQSHATAEAMSEDSYGSGERSGSRRSSSISASSSASGLSQGSG